MRIMSLRWVGVPLAMLALVACSGRDQEVEGHSTEAREAMLTECAGLELGGAAHCSERTMSLAAAESSLEVRDAIEAARRMDVRALKQYLDAGGDPNANPWEPLLEISATRGSLAAVQALVEAGADVSLASERWGSTALSRALENHELDIAEYLLRRGAVCGDRTTMNAISVAMDRVGSKETWRRLMGLVRGFRCLEISGEPLSAPLVDGLNWASTEDIRYLLSLPNVSPDALLLARVYPDDRVDVLQMAFEVAPGLLEPRSGGRDARTPLELAMTAGAHRIVAHLLQRGVVLPATGLAAYWLETYLRQAPTAARFPTDGEVYVQNVLALLGHIGADLTSEVRSQRYEADEGEIFVPLVVMSRAKAVARALEARPETRIPPSIAYKVVHRVVSDMTFYADGAEVRRVLDLVGARGGVFTEGGNTSILDAVVGRYVTNALDGFRSYQRFAPVVNHHLVSYLEERGVLTDAARPRHLDTLLRAYDFEDASRLVRRMPSLLGDAAGTLCGKILSEDPSLGDALSDEELTAPCSVGQSIPFGALSLALGTGRVDVARRLLAAGADPNGGVARPSDDDREWLWERKRYSMPLFVAIYLHRDDVLADLVDRGAMLDVPFSSGWTISESPWMASIHAGNALAYDLIASRLPGARRVSQGDERPKALEVAAQEALEALAMTYSPQRSFDVPPSSPALLVRAFDELRATVGDSWQRGKGEEAAKRALQDIAARAAQRGEVSDEELSLFFHLLGYGVASPWGVNVLELDTKEQVSPGKLRLSPERMARWLSAVPARELLFTYFESLWPILTDPAVLEAMSAQNGSKLAPFFEGRLYEVTDDSSDQNRRTAAEVRALVNAVSLEYLTRLRGSYVYEKARVDVQAIIDARLASGTEPSPPATN